MIDIAKIPLLAGLKESELARLQARVVERKYPKGAVVLLEGQESDGMYIIGSGLVKIYKLHEDGREATLALLGAGEILGEMSLFGSKVRSASAEAVEPSTLLVISRNDFKSLMVEIPEIAVHIIEVLSTRLRNSDRQVHELAFLNSRGRIVSNLARLAETHGRADTDGILVRLTHAELAKIAGASRETVTKVLNELSDVNVIRLGNRKLWVLDLEGLYGRLG